jgi:uncharacterized protein
MSDVTAPLVDPARAGSRRPGLGPVARIALRALRAYKLLLSPLFTGSCRYLPSCSDYAAEAIERHGAAAGLGLGARRLCRCHPFGGSGYDPVPEINPRRQRFVSTKSGGGIPSSPARADART